MFPLIPALILLLLHGPANFEKLAETGRLPASLAVFRHDAPGVPVHQDLARQDVSRRALATLIAASGDRALTEAFASMFLAGEPRPATPTEVRRFEIDPPKIVFDDRPPVLPDGFLRFVRSRDGPASA